MKIKSKKLAMNTAELVHYIKTNETEDTAEDMMYCLRIDAENRFEKACKELEKLMKDIQTIYPDARYVADNSTIKLFLGDDHSDQPLEFGCVRKAPVYNGCLIAARFYMKSFCVVKD